MLLHDVTSARAKYKACVLICIYSLSAASVRRRTNVVSKPTVREHERLTDGFFILYILLYHSLISDLSAFYCYLFIENSFGSIYVPFFLANTLLKGNNPKCFQIFANLIQGTTCLLERAEFLASFH